EAVVVPHRGGRPVALGGAADAGPPTDPPAVEVGAAPTVELERRVGGLLLQRVGRGVQQRVEIDAGAVVPEDAAHVSRRPGRSGSRRRYGGGWGSPSCGAGGARPAGRPPRRRP